MSVGARKCFNGTKQGSSRVATVNYFFYWWICRTLNQLGEEQAEPHKHFPCHYQFETCNRHQKNKKLALKSAHAWQLVSMQLFSGRKVAAWICFAQYEYKVPEAGSGQFPQGLASPLPLPMHLLHSAAGGWVKLSQKLEMLQPFCRCNLGGS